MQIQMVHVKTKNSGGKKNSKLEQCRRKFPALRKKYMKVAF